MSLLTLWTSVVVAVVLSVTICTYVKHVWCACRALEGLDQAQMLFFETAEGKLAIHPVERITTYTAHLKTRMILFWLIKNLLELEQFGNQNLE